VSAGVEIDEVAGPDIDRARAETLAAATLAVAASKSACCSLLSALLNLKTWWALLRGALAGMLSIHLGRSDATAPDYLAGLGAVYGRQ
jgi:hypothetical protein